MRLAAAVLLSLAVLIAASDELLPYPPDAPHGQTRARARARLRARRISGNGSSTTTTPAPDDSPVEDDSAPWTEFTVAANATNDVHVHFRDGAQTRGWS